MRPQQQEREPNSAFHPLQVLQSLGVRAEKAPPEEKKVIKPKRRAGLAAGTMEGQSRAAQDSRVKVNRVFSQLLSRCTNHRPGEDGKEGTDPGPASARQPLSPPVPLLGSGMGLHGAELGFFSCHGPSLYNTCSPSFLSKA